MALAVTVGSMILQLAPTTISAQETIPLTPRERAAVIAAIEAAPSHRAASLRPRDARMFATKVWAYRIKGADRPARRLAEVAHFKYDGGQTIRTTYDLDGKRVLKVETLDAYPTPLAPAELTAAVDLAKELVPAVKALYAKQGDKVRTDVLVPVVADKASPLFGHRTVHMTFRATAGGDGGVTVELDLTDRKLIPMPGETRPGG